MPRYVAFLRAINVGGRNVVAMSALKREFERAGCLDVETFIASGNVIFRHSSRSAAVLERHIEAVLTDALGFDVATFLRTDAEVEAVARYRPFPQAAMRNAASLNVGFVGQPWSPAMTSAVKALASDIDALHLHGREIYWMCRKKQSESRFSNAVLEKALKMRSTFRGVNTIVRLAGKLRNPV